MNQDPNIKENQDVLAYYAVAFLDVMGQKKRIRELHELPTNPDETRAALEVLRDTVGYLRRIRSTFDSTFKNIKKTTDIFESLPEELKPLASDLRASEVQYRWFSDSLIAVVPLRNENDNCTPMNGVFAAMWASCCVVLYALADGKALRGGIDVGWGVMLDEGELYGAALERAYALEHKGADYPRILIGDELWNYLAAVQAQPARTPFSQIAKRLARNCAELVVEDEDGKRTLDLAGPFVRSLGGSQGEVLLRRAIQNVRDHESQFREAGDAKLSDRYRRLMKLLEAGRRRQQ